MEPHGDAHLPEHGLGPDPATVLDVAVLLPGGLAPVVMAVPALRHLRRAYPVARITVAAEAAGIDLLDNCPYVDRCLDLAHADELLLSRYDLAVSLADPLFARSAGAAEVVVVDDVRARVRAGFRDAEHLPERHHLHPVRPPRLPRRSSMLRLAWLLGGQRPDERLALWPSLADRNGAAALVAAGRRPLALLHPGGGTMDRRWPPGRYGKVADMLADAGFDVVLVGDTHDRGVARRVAAAARVQVLDLTGRTSVGELAGLCERASLFVGNDSGPAMLAGVLGVQSVIVAPASTIEQVGPEGRVSYVTAGACSTCGEVACSHEAPRARSVPLEPVLAQVAVAAGRARRQWRSQAVPPLDG